jgi:hypothetical protein
MPRSIENYFHIEDNADHNDSPNIGYVYDSLSCCLLGLLSTLLYAKITPIDEFEEIRNNNIGVAIVVSVIIITLTMMCRSGVGLLIESIIPYPELPPN